MRTSPRTDDGLKQKKKHLEVKAAPQEVLRQMWTCAETVWRQWAAKNTKMR